MPRFAVIVFVLAAATAFCIPSTVRFASARETSLLRDDLVSQVSNGHVVQGQVTDAQTGEPLVSATVQVEGTYTGTITNPDGRFSLTADWLPVTLLVRYIGYATSRITVQDEAMVAVRLVPEAVTMPEIVVSGEDPAVEIMRRVIARKREWRAELARFRADAYTRIVIENDTGIVSITESLSSFWWDRELGRREVVHGTRRTANLPMESVVPAALAVSNLYDDDVELAGVAFMGVTHPDALSVYDVRLLGVRSLDGIPVFDISVEPRSRLSSAFVGRISVMDEVFSLVDADLRPGDSFLFPPPIQYFDITLRQQFGSFGGPFVLPVDFQAVYVLKFGLRGLLDFPAIRIGQVSRLDGYQVNGARADSIFADRDVFRVDSTATASDRLVGSGTVVPMTLREQEALATIDSTRSMETAFRPSGLLASLARFRVGSDDGDRSRPSGSRRISVRAVPALWLDRVAGVHSSLDLTIGLGVRSFLGGMVGYDSNPGSVPWGVHGEIVLHAPRRTGRRTNRSADEAAPSLWSRIVGARLSVVGSYAEIIDRRIASRTQDPYFNTLRVILNGHDYLDYLHRGRLEAGLRWVARRNAGLRLEAMYRVDDDRSMQTGRPVRFLGTAAPRPNPPIVDGRLRSFVGRARLGTRPDDFGFSGANGGELTIEYSPEGAASSTGSFVRADLRVDVRLETFLRRRLLPNVLDVAVTASHATGPLPPQRWGIVDGTGTYSSFGALRTLQDVFYEGSSHVFVGWEHNFRTVPFELIGAYGLARRNYSVTITGAHGRTWLSDSSRRLARHVPIESVGWHHEVGASLGGLLRIFRLDVTRRLDEPAWRVGVGTARIF